MNAIFLLYHFNLHLTNSPFLCDYTFNFLSIYLSSFSPCMSMFEKATFVPVFVPTYNSMFVCIIKRLFTYVYLSMINFHYPSLYFSLFRLFNFPALFDMQKWPSWHIEQYFLIKSFGWITQSLTNSNLTVGVQLFSIGFETNKQKCLLRDSAVSATRRRRRRRNNKN